MNKEQKRAIAQFCEAFGADAFQGGFIRVHGDVIDHETVTYARKNTKEVVARFSSALADVYNDRVGEIRAKIKSGCGEDL